MTDEEFLKHLDEHYERIPFRAENYLIIDDRQIHPTVMHSILNHIKQNWTYKVVKALGGGVIYYNMHKYAYKSTFEPLAITQAFHDLWTPKVLAPTSTHLSDDDIWEIYTPVILMLFE